MTTDALNRATLAVSESELAFMPLTKEAMPGEFSEYKVSRDSVLDNEMMAQHGFPGNTAEGFRRAGRISGYMRELSATSPRMPVEGDNVMAATIVHLFDSPESVRNWMHDFFLKEFEENIGKELSEGQELVSAERLEPQGFFDESVALKVVHKEGDKLVSVTIVDFRVGCILGVAFVGAIGDQQRLDAATEIGAALEKHIVSVVLGAA